MNPWLALGPAGMISVGFISIALWKLKSLVKLKYFAVAGLIWVTAIAPKLVMDLTVTPILSAWTKAVYGLTGFIVIIGAYIGLRTGLFECGLMYLAFSKSKLRTMSFNEAVAFGVGFGAFEAILIGIPSLMQILTFTFNPSLLNVLPPPQRQIVEASLSLPTWVVAAPVIERVFALFAHLFTALLVFVSVIWRKVNLFLEAFVYKSLLDAVIPYIQVTLKPSVSPIGMYQAEVWVGIMGLVAIAGIRWIRRVYLEVHG